MILRTDHASKIGFSVTGLKYLLDLEKIIVIIIDVKFSLKKANFKNKDFLSIDFLLNY